jgi:hypothetical protein
VAIVAKEHDCYLIILPWVSLAQVEKAQVLSESLSPSAPPTMNELRQDSNDAHSLDDKKAVSLTSSAANAVQYNKVYSSLSVVVSRC